MTSDTRSPEEIERDIERERAGLRDTLGDLQDKFSVETIARQFTDQFREHGGDIGRSVSDAVKRNPVALALTGVGIAWLMMGNRSDDVYRRDDYNRRDDYRRYRSRLDHEGSHDDARSSYDRDDRLSRSQQWSSPNRHLYSGRFGSTHDAPAWARTRHVDDENDVTERIGQAASSARSSVSDATARISASASDAGSRVAETARSAGSGVADKAKDLAASAKDAGSSTAETVQNLSSSAADRAAALRDRLAQGTEDLTEEARKRVIDARHRAVEAREAAAEYARKGRDRAIDIFEEQPLIAGALAVALGAALGAALPRTQIEDEYLGEQSDNLIEEAERIFAEEKEKLGKVADAVKDEAGKAARDLKDEADEATSKVAQTAKDKATSAGKRVADAARTEAEQQDLGDVKKSPKSSS